MPTPIDDYTQKTFIADSSEGKSIRHEVYWRGSGPPIVLIQELPGIGVETLRLADELVGHGFQVVMPHLFGPIGKTHMVGNLVRVFCMRREFRLFQSNQSSPIVSWLKALCRHVKETSGAAGVGAIGMCLTGNFAISLMADDSVLAAVASQPSLPLFRQSALHMSGDEIQQAKDNLDHVGPMMALRFEGDKLCTGQKFACLHEEFNDSDTDRVTLRTLPGNGHSVLTLDFLNEAGHPTRQALDDLVAYFKRTLSKSADSKSGHSE